MVACPQCGEQYSEQVPSDGLCVKCGTSLPGVRRAMESEARQSNQTDESLGTLLADNGGESLALELPDGSPVQVFTYDDDAPWPTAATSGVPGTTEERPSLT